MSVPITEVPRRRARLAVPADPVLLAVGLAGLVIAVLCAIAVAVRGRFIPPEGKMWAATTFSFGVAVFTLTVALLLPLAGYPPKLRRRWALAYCIFAVYGFVLEPVQSFRGLDPRFTEAGSPMDVIAGVLFAFTAVLNTVLFVLLGLRFFRGDVLADRPVLRLGIRYGAVAVFLSFGVGVVMIVVQGRVFGDEGNLLVSHGLGVHGIQALPLVALALARGAGSRQSTPWMHAAGIGWLTACTAALVQALLGRPPFEASVLTLLVLAGLAAWAVVVVHAVLTWNEWPRPARLLRRV
jgi:hypothetical protein